MEVVPLPDIIAEIVGKAFYEHWICRFGVPATIINDQGRQFESQLFRKVAAICGVKVGKQVNIYVDRLKPAYLLEPDHDNRQTTAEHKSTTPNSVDPHLMPYKQPTTSRGRKINKPVRFRE
ncbi:integrase catalytic domain-containing protein [Nephila pilipes]|uniref:Integrase catalytic domain-containing protein n=1 Tax=Nephila pilipes TaxID=299642 RepID=A0A8X6PIC8_NEPPI|nr:integrase catalytic domain-containing protein [Nephila pilipes]